MSLKSLYKLLDNWVSKNANGKYYSDDFIEEKEENLIVGDSYGIQQNRKEIFSFIKTKYINKKTVSPWAQKQDHLLPICMYLLLKKI